jgi:hypothetical protein
MDIGMNVALKIIKKCNKMVLMPKFQHQPNLKVRIIKKGQKQAFNLISKTRITFQT